MQEERTQKRAEIDAVVRLRSPSIADFVEAHAHDISEGGLFVSSSSPMPKNTLVKIEIEIESEAIVKAVGRVVWTRSVGRPDLPSGMGIKFVRLEESARTRIAQMVADSGSGEKSSFERAADRDEDGLTPSELEAELTRKETIDDDAPVLAVASEPATDEDESEDHDEESDEESDDDESDEEEDSADEESDEDEEEEEPAAATVGANDGLAAMSAAIAARAEPDEEYSDVSAITKAETPLARMMKLPLEERGQEPQPTRPSKKKTKRERKLEMQARKAEKRRQKDERRPTPAPQPAKRPSTPPTDVAMKAEPKRAKKPAKEQPAARKAADERDGEVPAEASSGLGASFWPLLIVFALVAAGAVYVLWFR